MTDPQAKSVGGIQGVKAGVFSIIIAYVIMAFLCSEYGLVDGLLWMMTVNFKLNLLAGGTILLISSYVWGHFAGHTILIKKKKDVVIGMRYSLLVLLTTAFFSGWVGFFQEGMSREDTLGVTIYS